MDNALPFSYLLTAGFPSPDSSPYKVVAEMAEAAKPAPSNVCPQATSLLIIPLSNQLCRVTG